MAKDKATKIERVSLDAIVVPPRLRRIDQDKVRWLAENMADQGLQQPINIWSPDDSTCELIAGAHRLEAAKFLSWEKIDCLPMDHDALGRQLWEIDENLMRIDLTALERAKHTAKRADIVRQQELLAKSAKKLAHRPNTGQTKFSKGMAKQTGRSERAVRQDKRRGEKIADDVAEEISRMPFGDKIANSGEELDALANAAPYVQKLAIGRIRSGRANTVRQAIAQLKPPDPLPDINKLVEQVTSDLVKILSHDSDAERVAKIKELAKHQDGMDEDGPREMRLTLEDVSKRATALAELFEVSQTIGQEIEVEPTAASGRALISH